MYIFIGSNSGVSEKILNFSFGNEKIIALYRNKKPVIKKKNIIFKKFDLKQGNFSKLISYIDKQDDKKITLVNFSSLKNDKLSINIKKKEFKDTFEVNLFCYFNLVQTILPIMIRNNWGRVINISSTGGLRGDIGTALYTSSKNASLGLFKVLSKEYAKFNITFNTISLGSFNTGMFHKLTKKIQLKIIENIPSKKNGSFKNILNGIKFIKNSNYVNGSVINIDGGM
ncbi:SDR family NAD(P)-dependent oxidoreductase [Candidatus Pelagibacter sp.]|nr:SDR family NAD(P)-dependent oxidoreductase [Candidatus Pelagibacter sp.]